MIIKDMFKKSIDRDIQGVIKVAQIGGEGINEAIVRQELDEYVVTKELNNHFARFFSAYSRSINGNTDKMGVWISGFFGSGKSHFLKILSYLLENKKVDNKHAIDFFVDDGKIVDQMVLADMKLCGGVAEHTDVILFNIDSKSDQSGKDNKDAIVKVFLKVFNEKMGYCGAIPHLADLERNLDEKDRYDEFKELFEKGTGKKWIDDRNNFDFIQDKVMDILVEMNFMSRDTALSWCNKSIGGHVISIDRFTDMVKQHIYAKGDKHHVVFLVDEVGQYIGSDSNLMLNLQTVTEDLGTKCKGKAWVIVTSQQDMDAISKGISNRANDFSKIQGRFDTRISMTSTNVDEVIKKRILDKTQVAEQTLSVLYEQKETMLKNLLLFKDSAEMKLYRNVKDFDAVYPFIPYQFNLLASVLTSIRTHGASGKHLSEGERSMLALFKESAQDVKDKEVGAIVPFCLFYNALHQFLDHSHSGVIEKAKANEIINPDRNEVCFSVDLLKVLFMIKYVKEIDATIDNLTSLMISSVDDDRVMIKSKVEKSLRILIGEKLIQKNGETYIFLTNEEQDVNREIDSQTVDTSEVINKVSERIFLEIYKERNYRYSKHSGKYMFPYNQMVDSRSTRPNQSFDIGINIITPWNDTRDENTIRLASKQENTAFVLLPDDASFMDEIQEAEKIGKYLRTSMSGISKTEEIKDQKGREKTQRLENSKVLLVDSLGKAEIYVNGSKDVITAKKDVVAKLNSAMEQLVANVYNKLVYIDSPKSESDIVHLIRNQEQKTLEIAENMPQNARAIIEFEEYLDTVSKTYGRVTLSNLIDRYKKAPFGFNDEDTRWVIAKLFVGGYISLMVNGNSVTLENKKEEIINYLTKKEFSEKLTINKQKRADESQKKAVSEVLKKLFDVTPKDNDDGSKSLFTKKAVELNSTLNSYPVNEKYPGNSVLKKGKELMREIIQSTTPSEFFGLVFTRKAEFLQFSDDFEPIQSFYGGSQRGIFDNALKTVELSDKNWILFDDPDAKQIIERIREIIFKESPYSDIPKLPGLTSQFNEKYNVVLEKEREEAHRKAVLSQNSVDDELKVRAFKNEFQMEFDSEFIKLKNEIDGSNDIIDLRSKGEMADALKIKQLQRIHDKEAKLQVTDSKSQEGKTNDLIQKSTTSRIKTVSIRNLVSERSWQIKNESDINVKVEELRKRLKEELKEEILQVEF